MRLANLVGVLLLAAEASSQSGGVGVTDDGKRTAPRLAFLSLFLAAINRCLWSSVGERPGVLALESGKYLMTERTWDQRESHRLGESFPFTLANLASTHWNQRQQREAE